MFKFLLSLTLALFLTQASGQALIQQEQQVRCGTVADAVALMKEYNEIIVFVGKKEGVLPRYGEISVTVIITLNAKTGTWSTFEELPNGTVCITNGGDGGKLMPPPGTGI